MPLEPSDPRLHSTYVASPNRYSDVGYERAGRSGVMLPKVSLGLWQNFGSTRTEESQRKTVLHAFDRGITHIDLANNYGPPYGQAEVVFGRMLADDLAPYREELFVSSKAGYDMWPGPYGDGGSRKYLIRSLEHSLRRMGTDYVDVFYHHRPDTDTPLDETLGALASIVASGKALYVGLSNYPAELFTEAASQLRSLGVPVLLHQPAYSMFNRAPEGALFDAIRHEGTGTVVFSPLSQGLLTEKYLDGTVPADSRAADSHFLNAGALTDDYLRRIRGIAQLAHEAGLSVPVLAVAWVLRDPVVTSAIVGASRPSQLDDAIEASGVTLDQDLIDALEEFAAPSGDRL